MSEIFVEHPRGWVGIPDVIPGDRWATTDDWAGELVESFRADFEVPDAGEIPALREYLTTVADSRSDRDASRTYVWVEDWSGPVYVADLVVVPKTDLPDVSLEEFAGEGDPEAVEEPILEPFVTETGLGGIRSVRYFNTDGSGSLIARQDYVWLTDTDFVRLYTAQFDLVAFELSKPRLEALARTLRVSEVAASSTRS